MTRKVRTGADALVAEDFARLRGRRVGLVCNQTTVESIRMRHLADLLSDAEDVELVALFGPEHGVRGDAQDMDPVGHARDGLTGVPVHSLYGDGLDSLMPTRESLEGLDLLIVDMQDVGSRYYTFSATMALCMKAAASAGIGVMVLDRPNPIGGALMEGPRVDADFRSFVGPYPAPARHGMTMGELALWYKDVDGVDCELEIVRMEGWRRSMSYEQTGLAWVHPSPNMPTVDTALVYPGMCLVEGTRLSEGRGTTRPFEQCGAPFIDPDKLVARLDGLAGTWGLFGASFRPCFFRPMFQKHAGEVCGGVFLHVRDPSSFRPWAMGVAFIEAVRDLWPSKLKWRTDPYEFVRDRLAIDLLMGSSAIREEWASGRSALELVRLAEADTSEFAAQRSPYLLYD